MRDKIIKTQNYNQASVEDEMTRKCYHLQSEIDKTKKETIHLSFKCYEQLEYHNIIHTSSKPSNNEAKVGTLSNQFVTMGHRT